MTFQQLPIQPDDGFPQAFILDFAEKLYRLTLRIGFLTLEPFKVWKVGSPNPEQRLRRALNLPLNRAGLSAEMPWQFKDTPERMIYALPQAKLYLVLEVARDDLPEDQRPQGMTRAVLDTPLRVGDLIFLFKKIHIARGNLLGTGSYGSEIVAGVKAYDG